MSTENTHTSYLTKQLEAIITRKERNMTFTFQKEKVKLDNPAEISFLTELNPTIEKDIVMKDDELTIQYKLPNTYSFLLSQLKRLDEKERFVLAYKIVQSVKSHKLSRIHLVVCPENIVVDQGLHTYFLHYGVKESLPPYENNEEKLLQEVKATVASAVDTTYTFDQYVQFSQTLKVSSLVKKIMEANEYQDLLDIIDGEIQRVNHEKSLKMTVNKKTWKLNRYVLIGIILLFIPAFIYSLYSLFSLQPRQASFIQAQEMFLRNNFSEVVTELQPYSIEEMPKVTQYQLSLSYIVNESLTEDQKETVRNTITLQTDPQYYEYWIRIGRGEAEDALDIARFLEDRDLILFGLLKHKEQLKSDDSLDREEREQALADVENEIKEYQQEAEEAELADEEQDQPVSNSVEEETLSSETESETTEQNTKQPTQTKQESTQKQTQTE
ncbi:type VII secretion protein EssB [Metabacillus halosaccharovorans]|uniref:Type VII secretion protein EssB n=1 Tax=Metabacillus halosaccharovorans TaxID=930124 RepID=A0ABT3DIC5_9BACI|nr:type VII secretion protein EssB [Metabacillus halosaccharovorans]MCV9886407.1 type VII secretion protein EssB [Metabacillus halosaccharovorans]